MKRFFARLLAVAAGLSLAPVDGAATPRNHAPASMSSRHRATTVQNGSGDAGGVDSRASRLTDAQVRQRLIDASIAAYPGNCPCPYSRARNGSRCGRRSAYDREGGAAPLCFAKDVTAQMVHEYREAHPQESTGEEAA